MVNGIVAGKFLAQLRLKFRQCFRTVNKAVLLKGYDTRRASRLPQLTVRDCVSAKLCAGCIIVERLQHPPTHRSLNSREFLAQLLHRFMADFGFAQHLHKARRCTEFAQTFLPLIANKCEISLASKG